MTLSPPTNLTKNAIPAAFLALALFAAPAPTAAAYDKICLKQKGAYTANGIYLRKVNPRATESLEKNKRLKTYATAGAKQKCFDVGGELRPGDAFNIVLDVNSGPDRRCAVPRGRRDGVQRWPEGGGSMEVEGHGTSLHGSCRIVRFNMWEGCGEDARGGFDQVGCDDSLPDLKEPSLFDYILAGADTAYARSMLERGADPHARRFGGETLMHAAVRMLDAGHAALLRAHGAKLNEIDKQGRTVLRALFDDHRDQDNFMEVFRAALDPDRDMLRGKTRKDYSGPDRELNRKAVNEGLALDGVPGVVRIVAAGLPDALALALEHGGDAAAEALGRRSALHFAARRSQKMVKMLLDGGADANLIADDSGGSPLHWALEPPENPRDVLQDGTRQRIAAFLLAAGADPNSSGEANGQTPLHYAAKIGDAESVGSMLNNKGDPNIADFDGRNALHHAAAGGHLEAVEKLLERGGNPALSDNAGDTPEQLARRAGHDKTAAALKAAGPDSGDGEDGERDSGRKTSNPRARVR